MKKGFAILLALLLILTACGSGGGDVPFDGKKPPDSPAKSFKSTIFGRNVSYNALTPAEGLSLPIPSGEIIDMVQIENRLYFLGSGGVHTLDIESGESKKLFDTAAISLTAHGGKLYTYCAETSALTEYDPSGSATKELTLEISDVDSVEALFVTNDYYVFWCRIIGEVLTENHFVIYSRETNEQVLSKKMSRELVELYPYKDNKLLSVAMDDKSGKDYLSAFDAKSGKSEKIRTLDERPTVAYCPKTDTALVFGISERMDEGKSPCCITEYSLEDKDSIIHNRYYIDVFGDTKFFLTVYENIVCAVSTTDGELRVFDFLNPPESITILGINSVENVAYSFEKETGILVKTAYTDNDKLVLKLMAGDDDFDIYNTGSAFHNYVDADAYVDLKGIESLNSRISGNAAADLVASYKGKYFGVPVYIENFYTEENFPEGDGAYSYSLIASENIYYAQNLDVAEKRYSDPDGEELYKLFKYLHDNPEGNREKMPFGDDVTLLSASVYLLNPQSQNSDKAIRFLEYLFDAASGDIAGIFPENLLYPRLESTENYYAEWRCRPLDIIGPIFDGKIGIRDRTEDFSNSELKKMANQAAKAVAMRMEE